MSDAGHDQVGCGVCGDEDGHDGVICPSGLELRAAKAALATSQADFANACDVGRRLEASLAASQAEVSALKTDVERWMRESDEQRSWGGRWKNEAITQEKAANRLAGALERARSALEDIAALKGGHCPTERGPCGVCRATTLARDFLSEVPSTPIATPGTPT